MQLQSIKGVHDDVHRARGYEGDCPCLHIDVHGAQDPAVGGRHAALEAVTGGVKVPFTGLAK